MTPGAAQSMPPPPAPKDIGDPSLCEGLEGCGGVFPYKTDPGLCARCSLVKKYEDNGEHSLAEDILSYIHCLGCGSCGKRFNTVTNMCGRCNTLSSQEHDESAATHAAQQQQEAVWHMKTAHANAFQARSSKTAVTKPPTLRTVPPGPRGGLTDTAHINTTASARADRFITVCIEARVKKELFHSLGRIQRSYPADKDMDAIVNECIHSWNESTWDSRANQSLSREDISLRWSGNILPELGTEHKKLGEFYDLHYTAKNREVYFGNVPKTMKGLKGEVVLLEILIDTQAFEERTGCTAPVQAKSGARGRPPKRALAKDSSAVKADSKRARTHTATQLMSTFRPAHATFGGAVASG